MEFKNLWPTVVGKGTFDSSELFTYILTNMDMNNLKGELNGYDIFENNSEPLKNFRELAYKCFDDYIILHIYPKS